MGAPSACSHCYTLICFFCVLRSSFPAITARESGLLLALQSYLPPLCPETPADSISWSSSFSDP